MIIINKKKTKLAKIPLLYTWCFNPFLQCAQNIKQLISVQTFASYLTAELDNDQMGGGLQATTIVICNVV